MERSRGESWRGVMGSHGAPLPMWVMKYVVWITHVKDKVSKWLDFLARFVLLGIYWVAQWVVTVAGRQLDLLRTY